MSKKESGGASVRTGKTKLSIEGKLKVLDCAKENPKESCRTLPAKFNVGKTQIAAVSKHEASSIENGGMSTVFYMVEQFDSMGVPAHFSHGMVLLDGTTRRGGTSSLSYMWVCLGYQLTF